MVLPSFSTKYRRNLIERQSYQKMKPIFFAVFTLLFIHSVAYGETTAHKPTLREISNAAQKAISRNVSAPQNAKIVIRPTNAR